METLGQAPRTERLHSFDILANVDTLRYDLDIFGRVLPETREQVTNEQLTFLVEGIGRSAKTIFNFKREGGDLVYFDDGNWRSYGEMVLAGADAAEHDAKFDPRRRFLADWAARDYQHYLEMRRMTPGQSYSWASPYPFAEEEKFGTDFLTECGLQPERKMGLLYQAICEADGSITLETQTIDKSDPDAIGAALKLSEENPASSLDEMVDRHDSVLAAKFGDRFYAGRRGESQSDNAWHKILENEDLVKYLIDGLETIARSTQSGEPARRSTRSHIYGVWALLKKRLDGAAAMPRATEREAAASGNILPVISPEILLQRQIDGARREFAASGLILAGCGGAISAELSQPADLMDLSPSDALKSIFSDSPGSDKFGSLHFDCPHCHRDNVRPRGKLIEKCKHCDKSVRCK